MASLGGSWLREAQTDEGFLSTIDMVVRYDSAPRPSSDLAYARPPSPEGKALGRAIFVTLYVKF